MKTRNLALTLCVGATLCALAACGPTRKVSKNPPLLPMNNSGIAANSNAGGNIVNPAPGGAVAHPVTDAPRTEEASALAKAVDSISPEILDSEANVLVILTLKTPEPTTLTFAAKRDAITAEGTALEGVEQNGQGYSAVLKCSTARCDDGGVLTLSKADGPLAGSAEIEIKRSVGVRRELLLQGQASGVQQSVYETLSHTETDGLRSRVAILTVSQVKGAASFYEARVITDLTPEGAESNDPDKGVVKVSTFNGKIGTGPMVIRALTRGSEPESDKVEEVTAKYIEADHSLRLTSQAENGIVLLTVGDKK